MVYHIVMWKFKPEIKEEDKAALKSAMCTNLKSLVGKVPGLLSLDFVTAPIPSSTHDMALVSTLEKAEDIRVYANHPDHLHVANTYIRPFVCERSCLDYEVMQ